MSRKRCKQIAPLRVGVRKYYFGGKQIRERLEGFNNHSAARVNRLGFYRNDISRVVVGISTTGGAVGFFS